MCKTIGAIRTDLGGREPERADDADGENVEAETWEAIAPIVTRVIRSLRDEN